MDVNQSRLSTGRAIDNIPLEVPRPQQMQVLCLGLSRTGTMSLQLALDKLGYKTYHYKEIGQPHRSNESHVQCWMEAFRAKMYGSGKPYGGEEFDRVLRNYSAVTDAPCCCFADELVAAYPEAKVVLNVRDRRKWLESMETSFYAILESKEFRYFRAIAALDWDLLHPLVEGLRMPMHYWTGGDWQNRERLSEGFDKHYAHVREIVPADNLLEWQPKDGWEPLCKFLDKEVPKEPFPYINKGTDVQDLFITLGRIRLITMVVNAVKWPTLIASTIGVAWWGYGRWIRSTA